MTKPDGRKKFFQVGLDWAPSGELANNGSVRLFVAVWPPDEVIDLVTSIPRPDFAALRWTRPDQWHVTLAFLGEVEPGRHVDKVVSAVEAVAGSGTPMASLGPATAWFPGKRVLQVPVEGLESLRQRIVRELSPADFKALAADSGDKFHGHLTIARVRGRERLGGQDAANLSGFELRAAWEVRSVSLVSSVLGSKGPKYSDVVTVSLGAKP